jgi:hypothetical protein
VGVTADDLAVNEPRRIVGTIPNLPTGKLWTLEITTQFAGSSIPLKEPRVITSDFTVAT